MRPSFYKLQWFKTNNTYVCCHSPNKSHSMNFCLSSRGGTRRVQHPRGKASPRGTHQTGEDDKVLPQGDTAHLPRFQAGKANYGIVTSLLITRCLRKLIFNIY